MHYSRVVASKTYSQPKKLGKISERSLDSDPYRVVGCARDDGAKQKQRNCKCKCRSLDSRIAHSAIRARDDSVKQQR